MQQFEQYPGRQFAIMGEVVMVLNFLRLSFVLDENVKKYFIISCIFIWEKNVCVHMSNDGFEDKFCMMLVCILACLIFLVK